MFPLLIAKFIFLLLMKCAYLQLIQQIWMEPQLYFGRYMRCWAHKNWSHLKAAFKEFMRSWMGKTKVQTTHLLTHLFKNDVLGASYEPINAESVWDTSVAKGNKHGHWSSFIPVEERRQVLNEGKSWTQWRESRGLDGGGKLNMLFATLWPLDHSPPGSSVHGILQARVLEWVAIPFSRGSSRPRDQTHVSCSAGWFFTIWATREAPGGTGGVTCQRDGQGRGPT